MDVGYHRAAGFRHPRVRAVGDIDGHALVGHKARPLTHQHTHQLAAGNVPDGIPGTDTAVLDENGLSGFDTLQLQSVPDGSHTVGRIGRDGR